jgi:hypothetical protein
MSRFCRLIITLSLWLTFLPCACDSGVASAHSQSGSQSFKHGELALSSNQLGRVRASQAATHEPISLALFGSGMTLAGVTLLRCSRRTKWSMERRKPHAAGGMSYIRVARAAHEVQYPAAGFAARDRFAVTYMSPASR